MNPAGGRRDAASANEADNLPMHVAACAERYKSIFGRLKRIEYAVWSGLLILVGGLGATVMWLANLARSLAGVP